jgi:hypothetical protein
MISLPVAFRNATETMYTDHLNCTLEFFLLADQSWKHFTLENTEPKTVQMMWPMLQLCIYFSYRNGQIFHLTSAMLMIPEQTDQLITRHWHHCFGKTNLQKTVPSTNKHSFRCLGYFFKAKKQKNRLQNFWIYQAFQTCITLNYSLVFFNPTAHSMDSE